MALSDGSDNLSGLHRWLSFHHRDEGYPVFAQDVDDFPHSFLRVRVHEGGNRPVLLRLQHIAHSVLIGRVQESIVGEPLIVEDLGQVAPTTIRQQHHDHIILRRPCGNLEGSLNGHATGATNQQPLLAGKSASDGK